jgi:hypothetical protein
MNISDKAREAAAPVLIFGCALIIAIGVRAYATSAREINTLATATNQSTIERISTNDAPLSTAPKQQDPVKAPADQASSRPDESLQQDRVAFRSAAFACQTESGVRAVAKVIVANDPKRTARALKLGKCIVMKGGMNATIVSTDGSISKFTLDGKTLYILASKTQSH